MSFFLSPNGTLSPIQFFFQFLYVWGIFLCASLPINGYASYNGFQVESHSIPLDQIFSGGPPRDGIPAILTPQFHQGKDVDFLSPQDRVLGIPGLPHPKAYPIAILNWHEIVNDSLDGTPVVITYCPLCGSGMGFLGKVGNQQLTFGVSGLLFQSDVLMFDHQTESLWSQIAMQAVTGPLLGQELTPVFLEHTTWESWFERYPHTLVLSSDTGFSRDYSRDPYQDYSQNEQVMFATGTMDDRLPQKEWVMGIEIQGKFKAYPFSLLGETSRAFPDSLDEQEYIVCWDSKARSVKTMDNLGRPIPTVMTYWFAWSAFHPTTDIYVKTPKTKDSNQRSFSQIC